MATFYAKHQLYPDNPQLFIVDATQIIKFIGEPNTQFSTDRRGEMYWEIVIYTSAVDSSGEALGPYWVDVIGSEQTIHDLISDKVNEICGAIDWAKSIAFEEEFQAQSDRYAPAIVWTYPSDGQLDVPIDSTIVIRIRDLPPAKGIDISTLVFTVGGYTLNPTINGNKYDYVISYKPQIGV